MHVRLSGGGVVPQGAGVLNLHLGYIVNTPNPLLVAEAHYQALCGLLAELFEHFGIRTNTQTVQGSFCDGRYNLAAAGRKIAGTAQHWQRDQSAANRYRVLSHAANSAADPATLTERANRFEQALGSAHPLPCRQNHFAAGIGRRKRRSKLGRLASHHQNALHNQLTWQQMFCYKKAV